MNPVLTFEASAKRFILEALDKTIDSEGFLVEEDNPSQRVLTAEGDEIHCDDFAGVRHGSLVFIKSDIVSLVAASDYIKRS